MTSPRLITVVIPVGPKEDAWPELVAMLRQNMPQAAIILCGPAPAAAPLAQLRMSVTTQPHIQWLEVSGGRARQLNAACQAATTPWVWCLHADTRLKDKAIATVLDRVNAASPALYYLDLSFAADGPKLMGLNAWAANVRSRVFMMPFGDQAFLFPKDVWERCGAFSESEPYGEDHVFVWQVRAHGIPVVRLPAAVVTSARKYQRHGWLRTTLKHFILTWRQAFQQWRRLMTSRKRGSSHG